MNTFFKLAFGFIITGIILSLVYTYSMIAAHPEGSDSIVYSTQIGYTLGYLLGWTFWAWVISLIIRALLKFLNQSRETK